MLCLLLLILFVCFELLYKKNKLNEMENAFEFEKTDVRKERLKIENAHVSSTEMKNSLFFRSLINVVKLG